MIAAMELVSQRATSWGASWRTLQANWSAVQVPRSAQRAAWAATSALQPKLRITPSRWRFSSSSTTLSDWACSRLPTWSW